MSDMINVYDYFQFILFILFELSIGELLQYCCLRNSQDSRGYISHESTHQAIKNRYDIAISIKLLVCPPLRDCLVELS